MSAKYTKDQDRSRREKFGLKAIYLPQKFIAEIRSCYVDDRRSVSKIVEELLRRILMGKLGKP